MSVCVSKQAVYTFADSSGVEIKWGDYKGLFVSVFHIKLQRATEQEEKAKKDDANLFPVTHTHTHFSSIWKCLFYHRVGSVCPSECLPTLRGNAEGNTNGITLFKVRLCFDVSLENACQCQAQRCIMYQLCRFFFI